MKPMEIFLLKVESEPYYIEYIDESAVVRRIYKSLKNLKIRKI